jgi:shikimate kinase
VDREVAAVRIALIGFMGAGKSTVGRALAEALTVDFDDADAELERRVGVSIPVIFRERGEVGFRRLERRVLGELLARSVGVVALGGGAVELDGVDALLEDWRVVYLELGLEEAKLRLGQDPHRPMLQRPDLGAVYARRLARYERLASITLDATRPVAELVESVVTWVRATSGPDGSGSPTGG